MKKDTYYFSHDATAKDDPKCMILIDQMGMEGYGIFWVLVETLRVQPDYKCPLLIIPSLARRHNTTAEKMQTVVSKYGLFIIENDEVFFSDSLNRRMALSDAKRLKLSNAGKKGNLIKYRNSSPPDNDLIATQSQLKESKGNENKNKVFNTSTPHGNLVDIFFTDLPKSTVMDVIAMNLQVNKDLLIKNIPDFRKVCKVEYPNFNEFANHFKNWVKKKLSEPVVPGPKKRNQPIGESRISKTMNDISSSQDKIKEVFK